MNIKVGTRKNPLALKQTEIVIDSIKHKIPELNFNIVPIGTLDDKILNKPLVESNVEEVLVSEFEKLIVNGSIDLAVHDAKDIPLKLTDSLDIVYVSKRANPKDVLITLKDITYFKDDAFTIGANSTRRKFQLSKLYPKAEFKDITGNIETRLDKLQNREYNAIVLASADLERLNITEENFNFRYLTPEECLCAGCQGIITIEGLKNSPIARMLSSTEDPTTRMTFQIERGIMKIIDNDCIGVHSNIIGDTIYADILFPNCTRRKFKSHSKEDLFRQIEEYLY